MNKRNRLLLGLAGVLVLAGVILAMIGYRLSLSSSTPSSSTAGSMAEPTSTMVPVLFAAEPLTAGVTVMPQAVKTVMLPVPPPPGAITKLTLAVGHVPTRPVPRGAMLTQADFEVSKGLVYAIPTGERAIAVRVNELKGVGGYLRPGDYVDVLLYMPANALYGAGIRQPLAQVLLRHVQLLAYGPVLKQGQSKQGQAATSKAAKPTIETRAQSVLGGSNKDQRQQQSAADVSPTKQVEARTAVLAVPEKEITRLMLGSNAGVLRLAAYAREKTPGGGGGSMQASAPERKSAEAGKTMQAAAGTESGSDDQVTLGELVGGGKASPPQHKGTTVERPGIITYYGDKVTVTHP